MLSPQVEKQLSYIELQCESLGAAVDCGEVPALETSGVALRQAAVELAGMIEGLDLDAVAKLALKQRLKTVVLSLGVQRGGLARRAAGVERALHAVVPATREMSYAQVAGPYGGAIRQSGAFKLLAA